MNKPVFIIILLFVILPVTLFSQEDVHPEEGHTHSHKKNEISAGVGVVTLQHEDELAAGLHLHYVRGVAFHDKLGVGLGFETIFDEHKHYTISAVFQYRVYKGWSVAYAPGLLMVKEDGIWEYQFAQHFETAYEWEIGKFHIGPMAEIGVEPHGTHYMIGVHFGIDF